MNKAERDQILKLTGKVGKLEGKLGQIDKNISEKVKSLEIRTVEMHNSVKQVIENHNNRINSVEEETAKLKGKAAGIALAVSLIISVIGIAIALWQGLF